MVFNWRKMAQEQFEIDSFLNGVFFKSEIEHPTSEIPTSIN